MSKLNNKQRLFVAEYMKDMNATRAAIRAGNGRRGFLLPDVGSVGGAARSPDLLRRTRVHPCLLGRPPFGVVPLGYWPVR